MQLSLGDEFKSDNLKEEKENLKKEEAANLKEVKTLNESIKKNEKFLISEENSLNKLFNDKKNCERKINHLKTSMQVNQKKKKKQRFVEK